MQQEDQSVLFSGWNKGQAKHPIYGFGLLQNIDVFENRGIAKLKNRTVLRSDVIPTQLPIAYAKDTYGNEYVLTGNTGSGVIYKISGSSVTTIASGLSNAWDIAIYKDYIWVRHGTALSAYGPLNTGPQWFANISNSFQNYYNGKLLIGQDDYLYSGNANYVAKIDVTASGVVGVAPSITLTSTALDLPDGQYVTTLIELGRNILIGTSGGASYFDRNNLPNARLYPWNRQAGTLGNPGLADLPVVFSENGINAVIQHANKAYVSAGSQGNIYITDGTNYQKIATIPYAQSGIFSNSTVYCNAMSISAQGKLLIGVSGYADGYSKAGIYEIDITDPKYPVSFQTISTLSTGSASVLNIGFVHSNDYQTSNIGWSDGATYGVDTTDFRMYASYGGVIETELVPVGSFNDKKTFEHIEFCLAEPLISGQNIRISYRLNNKDSYTLINTWGYSTIGGVISFEDVAGITDAEYVQLKVELDQSILALYGSNINLISVKLK